MRNAVFGGLALCGLWLAGSAAVAGPIEKACLAAQRGDTALCGCVQNVANMTLTAADQRLAAKFFTNPDKAEAVRMESSSSANAFWERYTVFGMQAEEACQPQG